MAPSFGENLKFHRTKKNFSREKLAEMMESNQAHVWRLETGKTNPRLDTIQKLCYLLGVEADQLIPKSDTEIDNDNDFVTYYLSRNDDTKRKIRSFSKLL